VRRDHATACAIIACMPFYIFVVGKNGIWKKIRTQANLLESFVSRY